MTYSLKKKYKKYFISFSVVFLVYSLGGPHFVVRDRVPTNSYKPELTPQRKCIPKLFNFLFPLFFSIFSAEMFFFVRLEHVKSKRENKKNKYMITSISLVHLYIKSHYSEYLKGKKVVYAWLFLILGIQDFAADCIVLVLLELDQTLQSSLVPTIESIVCVCYIQFHVFYSNLTGTQY